MVFALTTLTYIIMYEHAQSECIDCEQVWLIGVANKRAQFVALVAGEKQRGQFFCNVLYTGIDTTHNSH